MNYDGLDHGASPLDPSATTIDTILYDLRQDDETQLLFIELFEYIYETFIVQYKAPFEINIASLLRKRFSLTNSDISHYKKGNYDSIKARCTSAAAAASVAANEMNGIGNSKPLQFGMSASSAGNCFSMAFGLRDAIKKLTLDGLRGKNTNTIGNNNNNKTNNRGGNNNINIKMNSSSGASRISNTMGRSNMSAITIVSDSCASNIGLGGLSATIETETEAAAEVNGHKYNGSTASNSRPKQI